MRHETWSIAVGPCDQGYAVMLKLIEQSLKGIEYRFNYAERENKFMFSLPSDFSEERVSELIENLNNQFPQIEFHPVFGPVSDPLPLQSLSAHP